METWCELAGVVPDAVRRAILPWAWDRERLWALAVPVEPVALRTLVDVFDVPFWRDEDGTPFTVRPADVLTSPRNHPTQFERMLRADLGRPVDLTQWSGHWIVLDGLHRLSKAAYLGIGVLPARKIPAELYPAFAVTDD